MGNCLEPSQAEIHRAREAKMRKMAAHEASLAAAKGVPPPMPYPYPYMPPPQPQPQAYAIVDPQTGQGFIVQDMFQNMPPYMDESFMYYQYPTHIKRKHRKSSRRHDDNNSDGNDEAGDVYNDIDDEVDGKADKKSRSKRGSIAADGEHHRRSSRRYSIHDGLQSKAQQPNGDVGMGLFSNSGKMELDPETDPVIIDFLDPIPPTTQTTNADVYAVPLRRSEYEQPNSIPEPNNFAEESPVIGNSVKSEQSEEIQISHLPFRGNRHSTSTPSEQEITVFPPKEFHDKTKKADVPAILKKTLSQGVFNALPTDPMDVVITYSVLGEYELGIVRRLTRQLELVGLSVWAERLGDSSKVRRSDKTAKAILGAKVLIVLLSEGSCEQRFIRDHVAIATMTNLSIIPVASEPPKEVKKAMPKELKVQLSPYAWTELVGGNDDNFLFQLRSLARSVQDEVEERNSSEPNARRHDANSSNRRLSQNNQGMTANASGFWDVHFGHRHSVSWERMHLALNEAFKNAIDETIPDDLQIILYTSIMNRIVMKNTTDVSRDDFIAMCQSHGNEIYLWEAIVQVAGMIQAVKDVFEIDSTVRQLAVDNTEHFSNSSVVKALRDLLADPEPSIRSVAVVTLARCILSDSHYMEWVVQTLEDGDSLVREAGCLALGHLRAESATEKLMNVWKNDEELQVKEAAKMALDQIGAQVPVTP